MKSTPNKFKYTLSQYAFDVKDIPPEIADCFEPADCGHCYVCQMVAVFREVRRVLRPDGVLFLNLGDSYAASNVGSFNGGGFNDTSAKNGTRDMSGVETSGRINKVKACASSGIKHKDLIGIPWRVAFALQADGWWLRSEITWCKKACMPESVTDRPSSATEKVFLLTKSARYFYDAEAVREDSKTNEPSKNWKDRQYNQSMLAHQQENGVKGRPSGVAGYVEAGKRNLRNFWLLGPDPYPGSHFAVMPRKLVEPCILAGSRPGDTVLDPFGGSGTTAAVAQSLNRDWIMIELNLDYLALIEQRTNQPSLDLAA